MTSLLLYGSDSLEASHSLLRSFREEMLVFQVDQVLSENLASLFHVTPIISESYFSKKDYDDMEKFSKTFIYGWFVIDGHDYSEWNGISLGWALAGLQMFPKLIPALRNVLWARRLLTELMPHFIYIGVGAGLMPEIWILEAERLGIPYEVLKRDPPLPIELEWDPARKSTRRHSFFSKALILIRWNLLQMKALLNKVVSRCQSLTKRAPTILFLFPLARRVSESRKLGLSPHFGNSSDIRPIYMDDERIRGTERLTGGFSAKKAADFFLERWPSFEKGLRKNLLLQYEGFDLWPILGSWLKDLFTREFPTNAAVADIAKLSLEKIRPHAVVTKLLWGKPQSIWALIAKKLGIPVITLQREYLVPGTNDHYPDAYGDWLLTVGPSSTKKFISQGFPSTQIIEVGNPQSVFLHREQTQEKMELYNKLGLNKERPIVLYADVRYCATSTFESPYYLYRNLQWIKNLAREIPDTQFIVKFHPGSQYEGGRTLIQKRVNLLLNDKPENLHIVPLFSLIYPLLNIVDLILTDTSTVGLEGMFFNIPIIYLRTMDQGFSLSDFEQPFRAALGVNNYNDLKIRALNILSNIEAAKKKYFCEQEQYYNQFFGETKKVEIVLQSLFHSNLKKHPLQQAYDIL